MRTPSPAPVSDSEGHIAAAPKDRGNDGKYACEVKNSQPQEVQDKGAEVHQGCSSRKRVEFQELALERSTTTDTDCSFQPVDDDCDLRVFVIEYPSKTSLKKTCSPLHKPQGQHRTHTIISLSTPSLQQISNVKQHVSTIHAL